MDNYYIYKNACYSVKFTIKIFKSSQKKCPDKSFINEEYKECLDACYSSLFLIKNLKLED